MAKSLCWIALVAVNLCLIWQLGAAHPLMGKAATGALLALINLITGLRIGYLGAQAYAAEVHRVNRYLADQNSELSASNYHLLKEMSSRERDESEDDEHAARSRTFE